MQENSLVVSKKEKIFSRIKAFLKKIFFQSNKKLQKRKNISLKVRRKKKTVREEEYLTEKKRIFNLYNLIKEEKIDIEEIEIEELVKIEKIMEEELRIKKKRLQDTITELKVDRYQIKNYKEKIKGYNQGKK